jgi:hypothetical protein
VTKRAICTELTHYKRVCQKILEDCRRRVADKMSQKMRKKNTIFRISIYEQVQNVMEKLKNIRRKVNFKDFKRIFKI